MSAVGPRADSRTSAIVEQARRKRSESMTSDIAEGALTLFAEQGLGSVRVEDIAGAAEISVRTFYRYFSTKEDVLLVMIKQRATALAAALAARPVGEPPLRSLRLAVEAAVS